MAANPTPRLTPQQYLELERAAESRHEYFNGEMYAMAGGSARQSQIIANLARELGTLLKKTPCRVMLQDLRVSVSPQGLCAYPDVLVVCEELKFTDDHQDTVTNPCLLIEVLSPSTERYYRGLKFAQYRNISELQEYVLVSQGEPRVEVFRRQPTGQWLYSDFAGLNLAAIFDSVGCNVALAEIYDKVTLDKEVFAPKDGAVDQD